MTNDNQREHRCIELYDRIKAQFLRSHTLDDAAKGYYPNDEGKEFNRQVSEQEAALFVSLLIRFTSHMNLDDFNSNWFFSRMRTSMPKKPFEPKSMIVDP